MKEHITISKQDIASCHVTVATGVLKSHAKCVYKELANYNLVAIAKTT